MFSPPARLSRLAPVKLVPTTLAPVIHTDDRFALVQLAFARFEDS